MIFLIIYTCILNFIGVNLVCDENKLVFTHKSFLSTLSTFEYNKEFLKDQIKKHTWSDNLYLIILDIFLEVNCYLLVRKKNRTNCKLFNGNKDYIFQSTRISMIFLVIYNFILNSIGVILVCDENTLVFPHKIFLSTLSTFGFRQYWYTEFILD